MAVFALFASTVGAAVPGSAQTPTPCDEVEPAELAFALSALPTNPVVGDTVTFEAQITNLTGGPAGLPAYQLSDSTRLFSIESLESSSPQVTFVRYTLRAVEAGHTNLRVSVNFETASGCADAPVFFFTNTMSELFPIDVAAAPTASVTPIPTETEPGSTATPAATDTDLPTETATPAPTDTEVVPATDTPTALPGTLITPHATAAPNPAVGGDRVNLDASASTGPILEHLWTQRSGPLARLRGCFPTSHGCEGATPFFFAPFVESPTTVVFDLLLTSSDGSRSATTAIEITVLPVEPETPTATLTSEPTTGTPSDDTPTPTGEADGTPTPTPDDTRTPTCGPTGTPYCADECFPCPTIRENCFASACGLCVLQPTCGPGEVKNCDERTGGGCCACATPTPPPPTVTPGGPICPGDCNNDGRVTVDELVLGVNIALTDGDTAVCPTLDIDQNGKISINELIVAVGYALAGCPMA